VCCSDHSHCCPNATSCDVAKGQCVRGVGTNEFLAYVGLMARFEEAQSTEVAPVNDIAKCLADLPIIVQDVMRVYEDVEGQKIGDLISAITQLIKDGQIAVADCKDIIKQIVVEKMEGPNDIAKCLADLPIIVQDVMRVYEDVEGQKIGDLIAAIQQLIKDGQIAVADCKDVIREIVIQKLSSNDIAKCLEDLPILVADAMRVYEDIEGAKIGDLIAAIQQLIKDGQVTIADCKDFIGQYVKNEMERLN
jgi:hypothetical protein